ncbi:MAG: redoxin domain-containing protein [candidate division Zixibacteria bacterium]|nr:redoxin domain-containing protein [candidate division Zixibacteria bacterium]
MLEGTITAPEFPDGMEWLNTAHPLRLADLRGKIVLLDFWTFCCINCMHVLPDLKKLEVKYPDELVVIGVHSAKFTNEKDSDAIRQAILRYNIAHPVVNDRDFVIWRSYGARAWPTLVLINPQGKVIGMHSGEGIFEPFDEIISQAIRYFDGKGQLQRKPIHSTLERTNRPSTLLAFPGKVKADQSGQRLFITDSNHNRVLITDPDGRILDVIGSGRRGQADGTFETAAFAQPQGTAFDKDVLYIADTENHTIRAANLTTREVITILGTGRQARSYNVSGKGRDVALNSPWDVLVLDNQLYIAMAGSHQLWVADLNTFDAKPFAGSAREARIDGPLRTAALAQPSGLTTDGKRLYFADSEISAIRSADVTPNGRVATIIGEDLFEYGDIDGSRAIARLQHPLGVVYYKDKLYVADTYNSKIKAIDPKQNTSTTLAGTGEAGFVDGGFAVAQFNEPSGITVLNDKLYVADANNHAIRVLSLETEQVTSLVLGNLEVLAGQAKERFQGRIIALPRQTLAPGTATISVNAILPDSYHLIENAPMSCESHSSSHEVVSFPDEMSSRENSPLAFPINLRVTTAPGMSELTFDIVVYYCRDGQDGVCMIDNVRLTLPVEVNEDGAERIAVPVEVLFP